MRVVFAPHAYLPSIGGAERYTQGLAEGLATFGHEVHVVVADVDDPEAFYELGHQRVGASEEKLGGVTGPSSSLHRFPISPVGSSVGTGPDHWQFDEPISSPPR